MGDGRSQAGEQGGGPRVQTTKPPQSGPLSTSLKGMNETIEPRTASQGTMGGGEKSSK